MLHGCFLGVVEKSYILDRSKNSTRNRVFNIDDSRTPFPSDDRVTMFLELSYHLSIIMNGKYVNVIMVQKIARVPQAIMAFLL